MFASKMSYQDIVLLPSVAGYTATGNAKSLSVVLLCTGAATFGREKCVRKSALGRSTKGQRGQDVEKLASIRALWLKLGGSGMVRFLFVVLTTF